MDESCGTDAIQEWAPLTYITRQIKPEIRTGFSSVKQCLSCIDFTSSHIALGTDCGIVYWCPRSGHKPRELRIQEFGMPVTILRIAPQSNVFNWIATGDKLGSIHVFQISSKNSSEDRVYHIPKHHKAAITVLEWNDDGNILFSGDEIGNIKTCEFLFNKTSLVGNKQTIDEQYKIVQLSFKPPNLLLVSTLRRAVIIKDVTSKDYSIHQIGKKERNGLISLGGVITSSKTNPAVYIARAKRKIWVADLNGDVSKTLIFSDLILQPRPKIKLVTTAVNIVNFHNLSTIEFNKIEAMSNSNLVISHQHGILIVNPETVAIVSALNGLQDFKDITVHGREIMFLEGSRNVVRLGSTPDDLQMRSSIEESADSKLPVGEALSDISTRIKDGALRFVPILTATLQNAMKLPEQVSEADEVSELPPIVSMDGISPLYIDTASSPPVRCVESHEFENIALAQKRVRKKKLRKKSQIVKVNSGVDSGSDSVSTTSIFSELTSDSELSRHASLSNIILEDASNQPKDVQAQTRMSKSISIPTSGEVSIPNDIRPDFRSMEAINADVQSKERLLEETLHLSDVISSFTKKSNSSNIYDSEKQKNSIQIDDFCDGSTKLNRFDLEAEILQNGSETIKSELEPLTNVSISDQSNLIPSLSTSGLCEPHREAGVNLEAEIMETFSATSLVNKNSGWKVVKVPECLKWFAIAEKFILIGGKKMNVYLGDESENTLSWQKLEYKASRMFTNPSGTLIWKLDMSIASEFKGKDEQLSTSGLLCGDWFPVSRNVSSVALSDSTAWYICDNQLYSKPIPSKNCPTDLGNGSGCAIAVHVPCQLQLVLVSCHKMSVWVLSKGNQVQRRQGVSNDCLFGDAWVDVITPYQVQVKNIAVGPNLSGWIVSSYNDIYFTLDCLKNAPSWFQLLLADPIHLFRDSLVTFLDNSMWIADSDSDALFHNDSPLEGESWNRLCDQKWKLISAEGIFLDFGSLWLLSDTGCLFQSYHHSCSVMEKIDLPTDSDILCLAASTEVLWLLMANGEIFIRQGISSDCFAGKSWKSLDLQQINKKVTFQYLSIGLDSVWAVSRSGEVFAAVGSPFSMSTALFASAWVQVESEIHMAKVFVGPELHMVWAIDSHKNVYVRDAIFPDFQLGLSWILVPDIKAHHLSVSSSGVWAISLDLKVFRRHGISQNNYIGDYWKHHTSSLSFISVSGDDNVWGLDRKNFLVTRKHCFFSVDNNDGRKRSNGDKPIEDHWEIIYGENAVSSADE